MPENLVLVDTEKCHAISKLLPQLRIRPEFLTRPFLNHPLERETRLRMLFYSVAICHQTRSLKSKKHKLFGWDCIEKVFLELALGNSMLLDVDFLTMTDTESIAKHLLIAFSDDGTIQHSTIDRVDERANLLKELSNFIQNMFGGSFSSLLEEANGKLISHGKGFYETLGQTVAYSDPMRKKSSFLAKLLIDSKLFVISDSENYFPIMDYHMQRVLLRLGCVKVLDIDLAISLRNRIPVTSDQAVRNACIGAMQALISNSGVDPWVMNDIFWTLGRSCCNETTLCTDRCCMKDPCSFQAIIQIPDHKNCSFETTCKGFRDKQTRRLWEPIVETHYY
jgi:hypothetical protein